ncbi:MAG: hypothetical protein ACRD12_12905 [Acidimicrobiales bacterium]
MTTHETIRMPGVEPDEGAPVAAVRGGGDLTDELIATDIWTDAMLVAAGIPVVDVPFVSIGGGMGSFVMVDHLRLAGVPTSQIKVLSVLDFPWQTYQYLTKVSQIPAGERLRSDSASTPDNIWGWPSYALREAFGARSLTKFIAPLWQVFTEPILCDYYTPKVDQVFRSLERESKRIGYDEMRAKGQVRMVRRRSGGGYFSILTPPAGTSPTKRVAYKSTYVHVAVGYPGIKFLPDLQDYKTRHNDYGRVINAYEPHEHVYEQLVNKPGTVVIRGGGIVASRILQRLIDDRDNKGAQTTIDHLFRTYITGAHGSSIFLRRKGGDGWAYQGFNWPKSTWGGQLLAKMERLEGDDRKALYEKVGGTNTPKRKLWQKQLARGRREGWYKTFVGQVDTIEPGENHQVITRIKGKDGILEIPADYVIDCTGLEADIREHRLLADLLDHSGAGRNPLGKLDVERYFELRGTRSEPGRMYAVGSPTLGGYFPGVDTFLGLQFAAQRITDDLAKLGFGKRIGVARSTRQWWKWARNRRP